MGLRQKPVGFPKPKVKGTGTFSPPPPKPLDRSCQPRDYVQHEGSSGILMAWDGDKATIRLDTGEEKTVECC